MQTDQSKEKNDFDQTIELIKEIKLLSLKGNIVNFDDTYSGEIIFGKKIKKVTRSNAV